MASLDTTQILNNPGPFGGTHTHRTSLLEVATNDGQGRDNELIAQLKQGHKSMRSAVVGMYQSVTETSVQESSHLLNTFLTNSATRGTLKDGLRDTCTFTHEWIPCQLMADCMINDKMLQNKHGWWCLLQGALRTPTCGIVFKPDVCQVTAKVRPVHREGLRSREVTAISCMERTLNGWVQQTLDPDDECNIIQAHPGGIYFDNGALRNYTFYHKDNSQCFGTNEFHTQLLYAFDRYPPLAQISNPYAALINFITDLETIHAAWAWRPGNAAPGVRIAVPFSSWKIDGRDRQSTTVTEYNFPAWANFCDNLYDQTRNLFLHMKETIAHEANPVTYTFGPPGTPFGGNTTNSQTPMDLS